MFWNIYIHCSEFPLGYSWIPFATHLKGFEFSSALIAILFFILITQIKIKTKYQNILRKMAESSLSNYYILSSEEAKYFYLPKLITLKTKYKIFIIEMFKFSIKGFIMCFIIHYTISKVTLLIIYFRKYYKKICIFINK